MSTYPMVAKAVSTAGYKLPKEAWLAAYDLGGSAVLLHARETPSPAAELLCASRKLSSREREALAVSCHADFLPTLIREGGVRVLKAVRDHWNLDASDASALVEAASNKELNDLRLLPMPIGTRFKLWERCGVLPALRYAASLQDEVTDQKFLDLVAAVTSIEPLIYGTEFTETIDGCVGMLAKRQHLLPALTDIDTALSTYLVSHFRMATGVPERIVDDVRSHRHGRGVSQELCIRLADNPSVPLDLRLEALGMLRGGYTPQVMIPEAIPYVDSASGWDDTSAAAVLSRGVEKSASVPWRIWSILEIAECGSVSERLRAAALECVAVTYTGIWVTDAVVHLLKQEGLAENYEVRSYVSSYEKRHLDFKVPSTSVPPHSVRKPGSIARRPSSAQESGKADFGTEFVSVAASTYPADLCRVLSEALEGADVQQWSTAWVIFEGYSGTVEELVETLKVVL